MHYSENITELYEEQLLLFLFFFVTKVYSVLALEHYLIKIAMHMSFTMNWKKIFYLKSSFNIIYVYMYNTECIYLHTFCILHA